MQVQIFMLQECTQSIQWLYGLWMSQIIFQKLPEDDPKQRKPNIDLATKHLNWQPKIHLEEGLQETINYFRKVLLK